MIIKSVCKNCEHSFTCKGVVICKKIMASVLVPLTIGSDIFENVPDSCPRITEHTVCQEER
jgi:hypothetical protein